MRMELRVKFAINTVLIQTNFRLNFLSEMQSHRLYVVGSVWSAVALRPYEYRHTISKSTCIFTFDFTFGYAAFRICLCNKIKHGLLPYYMMHIQELLRFCSVYKIDQSNSGGVTLSIE